MQIGTHAPDMDLSKHMNILVVLVCSSTVLYVISFSMGHPSRLGHVKESVQQRSHFVITKPEMANLSDTVAIIVPYRDRAIHLKIFINYMKSFLFKQQTKAHIYVIEQSKGTFNRAKLFNVGYKESLKDREYNCFIFHDVDLLPEEGNNSYTCEKRPVHMSASVDTMNYKLPYVDLFGGVVSMNRGHMDRANGFSNIYWGWGGEDDDMHRRLAAVGEKPVRRSMEVSRYTMLRNIGKHSSAPPNKKRMDILRRAVARQAKDGLSSLNYTVINKKVYGTHTWILADLHPPKAALGNKKTRSR